MENSESPAQAYPQQHSAKSSDVSPSQQIPQQSIARGEPHDVYSVTLAASARPCARQSFLAWSSSAWLCLIYVRSGSSSSGFAPSPVGTHSWGPYFAKRQELHNSTRCPETPQTLDADLKP